MHNTEGKSMKRIYTVLVAALIVLSCAEQENAKPKHQPTHVTETVVLDFVQNIKKDLYREDPYFFLADTEFTTDERESYFRRLEKYIKNNHWNLHFTIIEVYDGTDDMADVILKARSGDLAIFMLGYWYDTDRWELDAYEFPALTFDRPLDQPYEDYVKQIIDDAREYGVPFSARETIEDAGLYYIEYK
jgi:hypothetical protein